jgi:biuret amidohydrolase
VNRRDDILIGNPVLVVVDIQRGGALPPESSGIPIMAGYDRLVANAERIVAAARAAGVPIVFFAEAHRRSGIDFGRELDGAEGIHCVEGDPGTELWPTLTPLDGEYGIVKRRYSCFFATELDLLLRSLQASTLVLVGGLTDVCVHYTFVDAHQRDYHVRVVEDCVVGSAQHRHDAALDAMAYLQAAARITTESVVNAFESRSAPVAAGATL